MPKFKLLSNSSIYPEMICSTTNLGRQHGFLWRWKTYSSVRSRIRIDNLSHESSYTGHKQNKDNKFHIRNLLSLLKSAFHTPCLHRTMAMHFSWKHNANKDSDLCDTYRYRVAGISQVKPYQSIHKWLSSPLHHILDISLLCQAWLYPISGSPLS